jgi:hypothetical protein
LHSEAILSALLNCGCIQVLVLEVVISFGLLGKIEILLAIFSSWI